MAANDPCTTHDGRRKARWPNKAAAEFVARIDERRDGDPRRAYRCWKCLGWHTCSADRALPKWRQRELRREAASGGAATLPEPTATATPRTAGSTGNG